MDMFACLDELVTETLEAPKDEMPISRLRWYTWSQIIGLTKSLMTEHHNGEVAGKLDEQLLESRQLAVQLGLLQDLQSDQLYGPNEEDYEWLNSRAKALGLGDDWLVSYHGASVHLRASDLDWETFRKVDEDLSAFEFKALEADAGSKKRARKTKEKPQVEIPPSPPAPTWDDICDYAELSDKDPDKFAVTIYHQKILAYGEANGLSRIDLGVHQGALTNEYEPMSVEHLNAFACRVQEIIENIEAKKCQNAPASGTTAQTAKTGTESTPVEESEESTTKSNTPTQDQETILQNQNVQGQGDYEVRLETGEVLGLHWFLEKFGFTEMPTSLTEEQVEAIGEAIEVYNHRADKLLEQAELRAKPLKARAQALKNFYAQLLFAWGEPRLPRDSKGQIKEWNVKTGTCTLHFDGSPDVSIIDPALYNSWKAKMVAEGKQGEFGITVKTEHSLGIDQLRALLKGKKASKNGPAITAIPVPGCKVVPRRAVSLKSVT